MDQPSKVIGVSNIYWNQIERAVGNVVKMVACVSCHVITVGRRWPNGSEAPLYPFHSWTSNAPSCSPIKEIKTL
jgi:hypothetical protein